MRLGRLLARDLVRSRTRYLVVGASVFFGVTLFVLFGGLGLGAYRNVVLPLLPRLPLGLVKVEPKVLTLGMFALETKASGLDPGSLDAMAAVPGVEGVFPVLGVGFPLRAEGGARFLGVRMRTDLFATGIDPELVAGDVAAGFRFTDPGPGGSVVPVLVSRRLLALYNSSVAPAIDRPRLTEAAVVGFSFELVFGSSFMGGTPDPAKVTTVSAQVVGFSEQATLVGITMPIETLRRLNRHHAGNDGPLVAAYARLGDRTDAGEVAAAFERLGLAVDETTKTVGAAISLAMGLAGFAGLTLFGLVVFAIAQTFFLLIHERQGELALMRAMGARRKDLRRLVVIEAALVGGAASVVGLLAGWAAARLAERAIFASFPGLPVASASLVALPVELLALALLVGVLASVGGALLPAEAAARADPSVLLRS